MTTEIKIGQVLRDKDKRALSGKRYVRVKAFDVKTKRKAGYDVKVETAICVGVYLLENQWHEHDNGRTTIIALDTLRRKFTADTNQLEVRPEESSP